MEREEQAKSRPVRIESEESWSRFQAQAISQASPVFVHFTASWCMPSVAMNPFVEELAAAYPDVLFLVVDVDEVKEVASKLEVKAMPTFLLMKDGAVVDKIVGANPDEIRKRLDGFVQTFRAFIA
uniref:Thioredoxin domain-containing protein n=1 Tax=Kalanchoe fedtschenkoi TaxID=63787 RepID=A0A7N0UJ23_KALFE